MANTEEFQIVPKIYDAFEKPRGSYRYRVFYGGRGGAKTVGCIFFAVLIWGMTEKINIMCAREFCVSLEQSSYAEICGQIAESPIFSAFYKIQKNKITGKNGTLIFFKGLKHNITTLKGFNNVDIVYIDEAENISEESWRTLIPTIRRDRSEIIVSFNPKKLSDLMSQMFVEPHAFDDDTLVVNINFDDNPFFPQVLEKERLRDKRVLDYGMYAHIWLGHYLVMTKAQVFCNAWEVVDALPDRGSSDYLQGLDFGFSSDPNAYVRCYAVNDFLCIDYELYLYDTDIDKLIQCLHAVPDVKNTNIICDSARPETIRQLKKSGLPVRGSKKGAGSVYDGILFLRSFKKILVLNQCVNMIKELETYSWKKHTHTGELTSTPIDAYNHLIDALRYAVEPYRDGARDVIVG